MRKMSYEEARQHIKENIRYFLSLELGIDIKKGKNIKCLNPTHNDKHPSMSFYKKNNTLHCFSCGATYDTFDVLGLKYQLTDNKEIFKKALEIFDIELTSDSPWKKNEEIENKKDEEIIMEKKTDYTNYLYECHSRINETDYWKMRGLSEEIIKKYRIGYDPNFESNGFKFPALILPTGKNSYTARNILEDTDHKNRYRKVGSADCFNLNILGKTNDPIFVVEGIFDALAISEVGANAIALGTTGSNSFVDTVKKYPSLPPIILALDGDDAGRDASDKLKNTLTALDVLCVSADIYGSHKDANEALLADRDKFQRSVEDAVKDCENAFADEKETYLKENSTKYQISDFLYSIANPPTLIETGFTKLDELLDGGIAPELIIFGAMPSLGKTTFALNITQKAINDGHDVLYFAYESGRYELMAKLLSLTTYQLDGKLHLTREHAKTTKSIMKGNVLTAPLEDRELFEKSLRDFEDASKHLFFHDNDKMTVEYVRNTVKRHIKMTGNKPIVIIDYIQQMPATGTHTTDKMNADANITALKHISRAFQVPVIGIASLNRAGYASSANMTSFKESGSFEYGADILVALQYYATEEEKKEYATKWNEFIQRQRNRAGNGGTIPIELVVLKNRNGVTGSCLLDFCPRFNEFSNHEKISVNWG